MTDQFELPSARAEEVRMPTLEGRHVYLRALAPEDYANLQLAEMSSDLAVRWRLRGTTPGPDQWMQSAWRNVLAQYLVISRSDELRIGVVSLYNVSFQDGFGYLAATRFDMKRPSPGLMLGLAIFLQYVFTCWDLRKLYMELPEYNFPQFASGVGKLFEVEGRKRDHYWFAGEYWDQIELALYRDRWQERGQPIFRAEALENGRPPEGSA
jgi:hypothetical protein